jgi:hypothetical protein
MSDEWWVGVEAHLGLDAGRGDELLDLGEGLFEGRFGNVGHDDAGTLLGEKDGRLEANATGLRLDE